MPFEVPTLKLNDPADQFGKVLNNAMLMEKMGEASRTRQRNAMLDTAMKSSMGADGRPDQTKLYRYLAENDMGSAIPGQMEDFAKVGKLQSEAGNIDAEAAKRKVEARGLFLKNFRDRLSGVATPEQYKAALGEVKSDLVGLQLADDVKATAFVQNLNKELDHAVTTGTWEKFRADQRLGAEKAAERHFIEVNSGGQVDVMAMDKYGDGPATSIANKKVTESPNAPKPTKIDINLPGNKAVNSFEDELGKERAKKYTALEAANSVAPSLLQSVKEMRGLLGKAFTGKGAGFKTDALGVAKALGLNVPEDRLAASESLKMYLKNNLLQSIAAVKQMGVTLTPMSNLDLQLLEDAALKQDMDPATIMEGLNRIERAAMESMNQYQNFDTRMTTNPKTNPGSSAMSMTPPTGGVPALPTPPAAPWVKGAKGINGKPISQKQYEAFVKDRDVEEFDAHFGKGSALRILGGASNGGRPLL